LMMRMLGADLAEAYDSLVPPCRYSVSSLDGEVKVDMP